MSFTRPQITHTFVNADTTPASASIEFTLAKQMTNGTTTFVPASLTFNLAADGTLAASVTSNLDPGTVPTDSSWRVDMRIQGADTVSEYIVVPPIQTETNGTTTASSPIVQLSSLTAANYMVGQSITGTDVSAGTTILSVNVSANQVTMSANATGGASGLTLTIGATIDLGSLLPGAIQVT